MKNISKELAKKLITIGVTSKEVLQELEVQKVFVKLKEVYPKVYLMHLYSLSCKREL